MNLTFTLSALQRFIGSLIQTVKERFAVAKAA
jgi:hypothetical protein